MRIALDAMGGDGGVGAIVAGAALASREPSDLHIVLVGQRDAIAASLANHHHDPSRIEIIHAPQCIPMDADAPAALAAMPQCSVAVACAEITRGNADALVSAGHTGATILAASRSFQRIAGIRRAALAAVYPTEQRHGPKGDPFALMLDVGATLRAAPEDLIGFARMGSAYAQIISDNPSPSVALLSNGAEPNRGTPEIVAAHAALREECALREDRELNFIGNIEGLDIVRGTADVVVCEGFLGNVVLKMLEGMSDVLIGLAREAYDQSLLWKLGLSLVGHDIRQVRAMTDWKQYGGAPLLGLDRVVIKAHGRSNPRAVRNALKVAAKAVAGDLPARIARSA